MGPGGGVEHLDLAAGFDATWLTARGEHRFDGQDGGRRTSHQDGRHLHATGRSWTEDIPV
ncbi:hypothetical protein ACGFZH_17115 [Streptomyces zaomyceticus]|uniref:hypothetical protein n=1 Tax=Streptomyces zaomyceticus TaxID=68286 RepID=UPI0037140CCE